VRSSRVGTFFFLYFELQGYARPTVGLIELQWDRSPRWSKDKLTGDWCCYAAIDTSAISTSHELGAWQEVIDTLAKMPDYASETVFYAIEAMERIAPFFGSRTRKPVVPKDGEFQLKADGEYEIRVLHFSPHDRQPAPATLALSFEFSKPHVEAIAGATVQPIDAPYDLKAVLFRTSRDVTGNRMGSLITSVIDTASNQPASPPQVVVPLRIKSPLSRDLSYGGLIAGLLLWQKFTAPTDLMQTSVLVGLAAATAWAVMKGVRRPV